MNRSLGAAAFVLLMPCLAHAQEQSSEKPGPEVQKLAYYLGTWKGHGDSKGGPFGPAGALSSTMTCNWFAGAYQMICRGEEKGPTGKQAFLDILSFDEKAKTFSEYSVSSLGGTEYDQGGTITGNKVTYVIDQAVPGKSVKIRYTETRSLPDLMAYRTEASVGGGTWHVIAEGEIAKVK
jgi:hypothetical protein